MTFRTSISTRPRWIASGFPDGRGFPMGRKFPGGRGSRRAGAIMLAAVLLATGCADTNPGGGESPTAGTGSPAASPTVTATPTPTASYKPADASGRAENVPVPVLPEVAKAETKEGAMAFAAYWFSLLSYGYETGDLSALDSVTSAGCSPCDKARAVIDAWNSEGRWIVGGKITTPSITTEYIVGPELTYQVVVQAHQTPLTYMRADGSAARSDPQPDDTGNLLIISFNDGAWRLVDVGRIVA